MQSTIKLGQLQIAIILLTAATAVIHLTLNFPDPVFILNGLGYLALVLGLYFVPQLRQYRATVRWTLLAFALVTIVAWIAIGAKDSLLPYVTKAIEVILVILLYLESRQAP